MDNLTTAYSGSENAALAIKRLEERRGFFKLAGGAAAGVAGLAAFAGVDRHGRLGSEAEAQTTSAPTDQDVLNFALNLEYLESNYYSFAVNGTSIPASYMTGVGTQGTVTGGPAVPFASPVIARLAAEIAKDENEHVAFLRGQLTSAAVAMPTLDLSVSPTSAFSMAAQSAGLIPVGTAFDPYASDENFLLGAYLLTDVGLSAYIGSSTLITSKTYLQAAAGILATEAYHASILRSSLYALGIEGPTALGGTVAVAMDPFQSTAAISAARAKLDGTNSDDHGIGTAATPTLANADPNTSVCYGRTPQQVLNVVYLNAAAVNSGGFYPAGLNGNVVTSG
ncbi:MAG: ferritin-like domain-containing protein [Caulobacteraceae bacterium]